MSGHRKPLPARRCLQLTVRYVINCFTNAWISTLPSAARGNSFCSQTTCVFGGSNPSRENGYSIGRVHNIIGRTKWAVPVIGKNERFCARIKSAVRLRTGQYLDPVFRQPFIFPGMGFPISEKIPGTPIWLLPEMQGIPQGEKREQQAGETCRPRPVLPSDRLLNRHSAAGRMKAGCGY